MSQIPESFDVVTVVRELLRRIAEIERQLQALSANAKQPPKAETKAKVKAAAPGSGPAVDTEG